MRPERPPRSRPGSRWLNKPSIRERRPVSLTTWSPRQNRPVPSRPPAAILSNGVRAPPREPLTSARGSERLHLAGGVQALRQPRHALVDGQRLDGAIVARAEGLLGPRAVPAPARRHQLQNPRHDRVPGSAGPRMAPKPGHRPEQGGAGGRDEPYAWAGDLLHSPQDRRAEATGGRKGVHRHYPRRPGG